MMMWIRNSALGMLPLPGGANLGDLLYRKLGWVDVKQPRKLKETVVNSVNFYQEMT